MHFYIAWLIKNVEKEQRRGCVCAHEVRDMNYLS